MEGPGSGPARGGGDGNGEPRPKGYLALVKPRVLLLLVLTGLASVVVAGGDPPTMGWLLLGGVLATASANIFNNVLDRDRDSLMHRTMWRPLPSGAVGPGAAAAVGLVLGAAGLAVLHLRLNLVTALLTAVGMLYYIVVYTLVLKPRTAENITIGGVAGAFPPLVGWAAVTGQLDWTPLMMGVLVILWTPPHFWSLALFHRDDYRRAGFPMLPVVRGEGETRRRIAAYSVLLVAASLAAALLGDLGRAYLVVASVLGAPMLALSVALLRTRTEAAARRLFAYSNAYLALLFVSMVAEPLYLALA